MSDREQDGFRGPVKMCIQESKSTAPNDPVTRTTTEYRPDGKLLETRSDHGNGFTWVSMREYDSDGRLTKIKPANSDYPDSEVIYIYDAAGRSLNVTNTSNGDRTDFQYDGGRKVGTQRFDPETIKRSRGTAYAISAWDATTCGAGIPLGGTITTIYDEADRPIEMQTRDANGQIISRFIRTYNAAGLLVEERPILENPAPMFLDRIPPDGQDQPNEAQIEALKRGLRTLMTGRAEGGTWNIYDDQNRLVTTRERNCFFEKTIEISYNDHGDKSVERRTVSGNSVMPIGMASSIEDDGSLVPSKTDAEPPESPFHSIELSIMKYSYQYDDRGNWTVLVINHSSGERESQSPIAVSRRMIAYY